MLSTNKTKTSITKIQVTSSSTVTTTTTTSSSSKLFITNDAQKIVHLPTPTNKQSNKTYESPYQGYNRHGYSFSTENCQPSPLHRLTPSYSSSRSVGSNSFSLDLRRKSEGQIDAIPNIAGQQTKIEWSIKTNKLPNFLQYKQYENNVATENFQSKYSYTPNKSTRTEPSTSGFRINPITNPTISTKPERSLFSFFKKDEKKKKGYMVIFNQEKFSNSDKNRLGSTSDVNSLCDTFSKFGFQPEVKQNYKLTQIKSFVEEISKKSFSKYACFVCVILSHGNRNRMISSSDNKEFHLEETVIHPIAKNNTLNGKPKIFIVSACRGNLRVARETDGVAYHLPENMVPSFRDILKCFSTYEGFESYRDITKGTYFIQALCDILKKKGSNCFIEDILKDVNVMLTERELSVQVPVVESTMSTNFCLGSLAA